MVIDFRALNEETIGDAYPLPNITEILHQEAQNILVYSISHQYFTKCRCTSLTHKKRLFPLSTFRLFHFSTFFARALSIQSNATRTKERIRYFSKINESDIIRVTKERYVRLSGRHCYLCDWPSIRQNSISSPNDYDRRILSYNQTNVSFCEKK